jgi:nucleoside 2-deoxyribosyltransferase
MITPIKVYIASPFFNPIQLERVKWIEETLDELGINFFSPRSFGTLQGMTIEEKRISSKKIYNSNVDNIKDCNVFLAVLDDKDTGTIFELGYAAAYTEYATSENAWQDAITIVSMSFEGKGLNVMLRECVDTHISSKDKFRSILWKIRNGQELPKHLDEGDIE